MMTVNAMLPASLRFLFRLLIRSSLRKLFRQLKTPVGAIAGLMTLGILVFGFGPSIGMMIFNPESKLPVEYVEALLPIGMVLAVTLLALFNSGKSIVEMNPAELQFVVAGPFSDKQILNYRLCFAAIAYLPMAAILSLLAHRTSQSLIGGLLGVTLGLLLLILFCVAFSLFVESRGPATKRVGRGVLGIPAVWFAFKAVQVFTTDTSGVGDQVKSIAIDPISQILVFPAKPVTGLFAEPLGSMTLVYIAEIAVMAIGLWWLALQHCKGFSEWAVAGIERRRAKIASLASGGVVAVGDAAKQRQGQRSVMGRRLGTFPYLGGLGPMVWFQLVITWRRLGRIVLLLLAVGVVAAIGVKIAVERYPLVLPQQEKFDLDLPVFVLAAMGVGSYLVFLLLTIIPSGLTIRPAELQCLKSTPIPALGIVIGSHFGYLSALTGIRVALFLPAFAVDPSNVIGALVCLFAGFVLDCVMIAAVNFVAAISSLRMMPTGTVDVLQGGRSVIFMFFMMLAMLPSIFVAAVAAGILVAIFGNSPAAIVFLASLAALMPLPLLAWVAAWRLERRELAVEN